MIYFRADGNGQIGVGHLMRCCAIANELIRCGHQVMFVVSEDSDVSILQTYKIDYYQLNTINELGWSAEEFCLWLRSQNDANSVVILDSYRIDEDSMNRIMEVAKLVYIDDLMLFDYPADVIINFNIEANYNNYVNTKFLKRKVYIGPKYYPSRDEFKKYRKRSIRKDVKRVLLTSSSTDRHEVVYAILEAINPQIYLDIRFDILVGKFFAQEYVKKLQFIEQKFENVSLLSWGQNMARLLSEFDLVIAPGSTILNESLLIGTPCISFSFVDNQLGLCNSADSLDLAYYIGDISENDFSKRASESFEKVLLYSTRKRQFYNYYNIFDGKGCERIVKIIEDLII